MLIIAPFVLAACGALACHKCEQFTDPTTEEEFNLLEYESPNRITWQEYQEKIPVVLQTKGMKLLKSIRDKKLQESDWICTADNVSTITNIQEFYTYRQRLRDLPLNIKIIWKKFPNQLDLDAMNFPVLPSIIRNT